ncbi:hypothetical protein [uncultured Thiodictyon sp.]|uniref:hypothetical protein n=1 Tax=uncultured Thiodictyon sp. TaxID=1846217 RepID=UPI0025F2ADE6|nr:hypothetical protein [uncultured Thiodictyon sp.]
MKTRTLNWLAACFVLAASCPATADTANPLTGTYYGTATIEQPASIGTIDLAFYLDVTGSAIQNAGSYIDLGQTLLFPAVAPPIGGKEVGPRVSGSLGASAFNLSSQSFQSVVSGKTVNRQVVLDQATVGNGGASLSGRYTETVTELTPVPLVISGTFILAKPLPITAGSAADLNGDGCLTLAEIRAGGSDPATIEFSDLSAALNLFHQTGASLRVGDPPGPNCTNGEQTLQQALRDYQAAQH